MAFVLFLALVVAGFDLQPWRAPPPCTVIKGLVVDECGGRPRTFVYL